MTLTQDFVQDSAFEQQPLHGDTALFQRLTQYLTDLAPQLHRYPEEEYEDVSRALATASGWSREGFFIAKTAVEAIEFLIEALVSPEDCVLVEAGHPYEGVLQRQLTIRHGKLASLDSYPTTAPAPKLIFLKDRLSPSLLTQYPGTAVVVLNPSQRYDAGSVVHLFEMREPAVSLNPLAPVYGYCLDFAFVETLRRVQEPFHIPTQTLIQMAWAASRLSFPPLVAADAPQVNSIQGILPAISAIQPYIPGKGIKAMARELQMPPSAFCKLASNEHPTGLSASVLTGLQELLAQWQAAPPSYQEVSLRLKRRIIESVGVPDLTPEQVQFGTGSVELIKAILKAFVTPESEQARVLFPQMPFAMYPYETKKRLASAHSVCLEDSMELSLPRFIKEIQAVQPQVIFLANPRNPLGTGLLDLDPLIEAITPEQVLILDEAYLDFMRYEVGADRYPDAVALLQAHPTKKIIALRTFSKSHALASFRLGFAIARPELSRAMGEALLPCHIDPLTVAAGIAALEVPGGQGQIEAMAQGVMVEKKRLQGFLEGLGLRVVPSYANFLYVETGRRYTGKELFEVLVRRGVIIRPVLERSVRVSIGSREENDRFITAMQTAYGLPSGG